MRVIRGRRAAAALAAGVLAVSLAACSNGDDSEDTASTGDTSATPSEEMTTESMEPSPSESMAATMEQFGAGCAAVPADGEGSFTGMADDPVATAASNNPELETLVAAVTAANLGDTLNQQTAITVFAPANSAFAKIPAATLDGVLADTETLTSILTYHVIPQRLSPDMLAGTLTTLQGATLEVAGSGEAFTVNDANVVCGNVQTANATVYIIDTVLMPPA